MALAGATATLALLQQLQPNANDVAGKAGSGSVTPYRYAAAHIFNNYRQNVFPPSSNMMLLEEDETLESESLTALSTCSTAHVLSKYWFVFGYSGITGNLTDADVARVAATLESGNFGLYLNVIWYDLGRIGCSVGQCRNFINFDITFFCLVAERMPGDVTTVEDAYTVGDPCSECSGEFPACDAEFSLCVDRVPTTIRILQQPGPNVTKAGVPFSSNIEIEVLDQRGDRYIGKNGPACYFEIGMEFAMKSHHEARLRGSHVAPLINGVAEFKDIAISQHGEYKLRFYLDSPSNLSFSLYVESDPIHIDFPPTELDLCVVTEGDPQFEVHYDWISPNCTEVCLEDCQGQHATCLEFEDCGPNAYCEDCACVCKTFRELDQFKFEPDDLARLIQPETICESDRIAIRLDKCGLNAIGFTLKDLYTLGTSVGPIDIDYLEDIDKQLRDFIQTCTYNDCRGYVTVGQHGLQYEFAVYGNFEDCNADVQENDTHVTYTHMVRGFGGFSSALVSRKKAIAFRFSCTYVKQASLSDFEVQVFLGVATVAVANYGHFDVSIGVWTNDTYSERYTAPPDIMVDDDIYIGVHLEGIDPTTAVLYAEHCYATPSNDPDDATSVDFIANGCADDDTTVVKNGVGKDVHFSFPSFTFGSGSEESIYVHCDVIVCVTNHAACTPNCDRRRKRAASTSNSNSQTLSIGPLIIRKEQRVTGSMGASTTSGFSNGFPNLPLGGISGISGVEIFI